MLCIPCWPGKKTQKCSFYMPLIYCLLFKNPLSTRDRNALCNRSCRSTFYFDGVLCVRSKSKSKFCCTSSDLYRVVSLCRWSLSLLATTKLAKRCPRIGWNHYALPNTLLRRPKCSSRCFTLRLIKNFTSIHLAKAKVLLPKSWQRFNTSIMACLAFLLR